jgi:phosphoglycolate phosphatase
MTALFDATRCADQTHPKPHPAMLLELADEFGVAPARVLMVGDTTHDLQMAAAARAEAVGVTYGAHPREQLAACQPTALVDSVAELRRWLLPH